MYLKVAKPRPVYVSEGLESLGFESPSDVGGLDYQAWKVNDRRFAQEIADWVNSEGRGVAQHFGYAFPIASVVEAL